MSSEFLMGVARDQCAACSFESSVFKQSFDRAGAGIAKPSPAASVSVSGPSYEI